MTYNVQAWRDSDHVDNFRRIVDAVREVDPDVCCLNEVLHPFVAPPADDDDGYYRAVRDGRGFGLDLPPGAVVPSSSSVESFLLRLSRETNLPHVVFGAADVDGSNFGRVPFGNAVLSRSQIARTTRLPLPPREGDADLGHQRRDGVANRVHPRQATVVTLRLDDVDDVAVTVCCAHLDHKSEELRGEQTRRILDAWPDDHDDDAAPRVFCGDLNSFRRADHDAATWRRIVDLYSSRGWGPPNEESAVLTTLEEAGFRDSLAPAPDGSTRRPEPTCWTADPVMRIDHVLYKNGDSSSSRVVLVPTGHERIPVTGSDHFPVVATFDVVVTPIERKT